MLEKPVPLELLADPVRRRVLEHLDRAGTATVDAVAAGAGVHVNTARSHLAALEEAGVVARERVATGGPGRPPLGYRIADGWRLPAGDVKGLADLLAASVASLEPSPQQLDALGREWGRYLAGRPGARPARELVVPAMTALGFANVEVEGDVVRLTGCPCRLVLPDRPELLCRLAAGVVDGLAAASQDRLEVRSDAHDPERRRCELRLGAAREGRGRRLALRRR